jgi:hypothetical protein
MVQNEKRRRDGLLSGSLALVLGFAGDRHELSAVFGRM